MEHTPGPWPCFSSDNITAVDLLLLLMQLSGMGTDASVLLEFSYICLDSLDLFDWSFQSAVPLECPICMLKPAKPLPLAMLSCDQGKQQAEMIDLLVGNLIRRAS